MAEAQLLGDRLLPENLRQRRQNLRTRIQDLRQPVQQRREDLSPFNLVGMVESNIQDLRNRVVSREGVLGRIRQRRQNGGGSGNSSGSNGSNQSSSGSVETDPSTPKPGRARGENADTIM